jgi:hypothetical protein
MRIEAGGIKIFNPARGPLNRRQRDRRQHDQNPEAAIIADFHPSSFM